VVSGGGYFVGDVVEKLFDQESMYVGKRCPKKGCTPFMTLLTGRVVSLYYKRSRLCVKCVERLRVQDKTRRSV
jgi:hypothetical protein